MNILLKEQESLLVQLELTRQKTFKYSEALIIEADIGSKFKLEKELESLKIEEKRLTQLLADTERKIESLKRERKEDKAGNNDSAVEVEDDVAEIVGFDLGHGETAISKTTSNSLVEPQRLHILNGKSNILTAIALDSKRGILIGDDAYCHKGSDTLEIFFKSPYLSDSQTSKTIKLFAYKCLQLLEKSGKVNCDENTYFYVGSPSGWTLEDKNAYKKLLEDAGISNVAIIPESRAAFLEAKESGAFNVTANQLVDPVLIIDIGSSTTDFTIVKSYKEKPLDFGHVVLGSSLLDVAILNLVIDKYGAEAKAFLDAFSSYPEIKSRCLLKCRQVKEKYFSQDNELDWIEIPASESERVLSKYHFDIDIYKSDMDEILSNPMNELDNMSWPESFRQALVECKETPEYQEPHLVLLTGGGSQMRFTQRICREVFPNSILKVGLEPHLTISKGLAIAGRTDFRVKAFRREIEKVLLSEDLMNTIDEEFQKLYESVAKRLFDSCIEISLNSFKGWSKGEILTLQDMEDDMTSEINKFVKRKGESTLAISITQWVNELSPKVEALTFDVCDKYNIPRKLMTVSLSSDPVSFNSGNFKGVINPGKTVTDAAGNVAGWVTGVASGGSVFIGAVVLTAGVTGILSTILFWVIYPVAVVTGSIVGMMSNFSLRKAADNKLKNSKIPLWVREIVLSEGRVEEAMEKKRREVEKDIVKALKKDFSANNRQDEMIAALRKDLNERANEVSVLVQ